VDADERERALAGIHTSKLSEEDNKGPVVLVRVLEVLELTVSTFTKRVVFE
jgi:hypothetical protein